MKKICALLLALLLLAGLCPAAHMEAHSGEMTFSVELGSWLVTLLEGEMMDADAARALEKVLENAHLNVQTDENKVYMRLLLKDTRLVDALLHVQDESVLLTTSLLPGVALRLPVEEQRADHGKIKDMIVSDVKEYLGAGEQGTFVLEGLSDEAFSTHHVIDFSDDALKEMVSKWVLEVSPESWTDVFTISAGFETDEEKPIIHCDVYTRADGDFALLLRSTEGASCTDVLLAGEDGEYVFALLPEQSADSGIVTNTANVLENGCDEGILAMAEKLGDSLHILTGFYTEDMQWDMQYSHEKLDGTWYMTFATEMAGDGEYVGAAGDGTFDGENMKGTFFVRYPENENLITFLTEGRKADMALPAMTYEKEWDALNLTGAQEEELNALLTGSAIKAFIYAASVMPDEIALLTNYAVMMENDMLGIIGGADGPTTIVMADKTETPTEKPTEEPAAEPTAKPTARPLFGK